MRIAVAGATGNIGVSTVSFLERDGHAAVRISRSLGVDLMMGEGLNAALRHGGATWRERPHRPDDVGPLAGGWREIGETMSQQDLNEKLQKAVTELQKVTPTFMPADGEVMTMVVEWPPGDGGVPPH